MEAKTSLRDRLKSVKTALAEKHEERKDLVKARDEAKEAFSSSGTPVAEMTQSADFKAAEQAVKALGECDDAIADYRQAEHGILEMLGESLPSPGAGGEGNGPSDRSRAPIPNGWNVQGSTSGEKYEQFIESGMPSSKTKFGSVALGQLAGREEAAKFLGSRFMAAEVTGEGTTGAQASDRRGIIPPNLKRLTLLDLIPTGTTDASTVEYVQVVTIPGSAKEWDAEDVKPEESFTTLDADAPVRTIAGWIKVRKQALADVAGLQTLLGTLLPYDVRRRIETQILTGDGQGQNLTGILNTSGIGAPPAISGDNTADAILRAITTVVLSDGDPDFVALHPLTQQDLMLMRENEAERTGAYLYGSPASQAAPTIWGLAMTQNRSIPSDEPLVGDSMAATLLVREGVTVLASDSDQDDFIRNRATLLAEARVAFPVWRPSSFAVAALSELSS